MANKKRSSRRNNHTGGKVAGGAVLLALLLAGGHFGLGIGRAEGGLLTGEALQAAKETVVDTAESAKETLTEGYETAREALTEAVETVQGTEPETVPVQEIVVQQDDGVLTVTVREDKLLYEGREVDLTQLEEDLLKDYKADSSTVELLDDHAIKAVYDEVSALLQKLSIPFTEGK